MKILRTRSDQSGNVLLLALVGTAVIGIMLGAYLTLVKSQNQGVARSQVWNSTIPLIEAGMEEALTHMNAKGATNMLSEPGWSKVGDKYVLQRSVGDGYYNVCVYNYFPGAGTNQTPIVESRAFITPPVLVASADSPLLPVIATIEIPHRPDGMMGRGVRATCGMHALFAKGLVANGKIDMSGNNLSTDSFDSLDPTHSNTNNPGGYDVSTAKSNGDVATNDTVTNSVSIGNATIHGSVATGPHGTVTRGPSGSVSGVVTDDMNVAFDDPTCPFTGGGWSTPAAGSGYTYVLNNNIYRLNTLAISGLSKILVTNGASSIWLPNGFSLSGGAKIDIAPGSSLIIYTGGAASIGGSGVVNSGDAASCLIYGLSTCTSISLSGNAGFTGCIYAPRADFTMSGGGNNTLDFIGATITKTVKMSGHFNVHYDEALRKRGPAHGFVLTSWNEMSPDDVNNVTVPN